MECSWNELVLTPYRVIGFTRAPSSIDGRVHIDATNLEPLQHSIYMTP